MSDERDRRQDAAAQPPRPPDPLADATVFETGISTSRAMVDGTWIARDQPYVLLYNTALLATAREVGSEAFLTLLHIAMNTRPDQQGRLVCSKTAEELAVERGIQRPAISKHVSKLKNAGFIAHERDRRQDGSFGRGRYVLHPAAQVDKFGAYVADGSGEPTVPERRQWDENGSSAPQFPSGTAAVPASAPTTVGESGHWPESPRSEPVFRERTVADADIGERGHQDQDVVAEISEGHQQQDLVRQLTAAGITAPTAAELVEQQPRGIILGALERFPYVRAKSRISNPAGLLIDMCRHPDKYGVVELLDVDLPPAAAPPSPDPRPELEREPSPATPPDEPEPDFWAGVPDDVRAAAFEQARTELLEHPLLGAHLRDAGETLPGWLETCVLGHARRFLVDEAA